ncbi:MAG: hypothetical protein L0191_08170 [Acidobacteria bacterium]|nr:hypothetical protein [Acidobacteriota bacterium]
MSCKLRIVLLPSIVLGLSLVVQAGDPSATSAGGTRAPQVLRGEQLTKQQLKSLPDTAVIEYQGQRFSVDQIRARAAQQHREAAAKAQAVARQAQTQFEVRRAKFLQEQQAKLQADNAKATAEMGRLHQASATPQALQRAAIQDEAAQLFQRSKTASPAERAQIEQRAAQLLQQVQKLGR